MPPPKPSKRRPTNDSKPRAKQGFRYLLFPHGVCPRAILFRSRGGDRGVWWQQRVAKGTSRTPEGSITSRHNGCRFAGGRGFEPRSPHSHPMDTERRAVSGCRGGSSIGRAPANRQAFLSFPSNPSQVAETLPSTTPARGLLSFTGRKARTPNGFTCGSRVVVPRLGGGVAFF